MLTDDATREPGLPADDARLAIVVVDERTARHPLPKRGVVTVGRGRDAGIRVQQPWVSRIHFRLHIEEGSVSIEDAHSSYGVFVRGEALPPGSTTRLAPGDVIEIGTTLLLLQREASSPGGGRWTFAELEERFAAELRRAGELGLEMDAVAIDPGPSGSEEAVAEALSMAHARLPHAVSDGLVFSFASRSPSLPSLGERLDEQLMMRGLVAGFVFLTEGPSTVATSSSRVFADLRSGLARTPDSAGSAEMLLFGPDIRDLRARLDGLAPGADVLLVGEPGTGKSALARLVAASAKTGPIMTLVGAEIGREGLARWPHTGTLILDRADSADVDVLKVIASRLTSSPGTRLIATTCADPAGWLDRSLAARFSGSTVHVPPLRQRPRDLEDLIRHFSRVGAVLAGRRRMAIPPEVMRLLTSYPWPHNLRELSAVVRGAAAAAPGARLRLDDFAAITGAPGAGGAIDLPGQLASLERQRIVDALERHGQNQSAAARALGIPRNTLLARIREYKLSRPKKDDV